MESQRELHVTFTGKQNQNQNNLWSPSGNYKWNYMPPSTRVNKTKTKITYGVSAGITCRPHRQTKPKPKQPMGSQRELHGKAKN
jgi:hypothetical protein